MYDEGRRDAKAAALSLLCESQPKEETVSCYLRHVKELLAEAGIEVTADNRKLIDRAFHDLAGVKYKDCPATWRRLKQELAGDAAGRRRLVQRLKKAVRDLEE